MIGQIAAWVVLLAIGCNVITGVGDLKIAESCSADAGQTCEADTSVMERMPLEPLPDGGASGAGFRVGDVATGSGGSNGCAASRDLPVISGPSNRIGVNPASGCGGSGGEGDGALPVPVAVNGSVAVSGSVAAACTTDADCADGLTCTTSADIGGLFSSGAEPGGPQNGYCSRPCNTDAECQAADPGAICLGPGTGRNHCFASCDLTLATFPAQCNGRDDLTCIPLALDMPRAYCAPACQDDAACAPRFCNLSTGLCQDDPRTGKAIGAGCTNGEECAAGVCLALRGQPAVCTGLCTFESPAGCGFAADASERDAACVDTLLGNGVGPGLCTELCDADSDCEQQAAGWACTPWSLDVIVVYAQTFARLGFCELAPDSGGGGGAGGGGGSGGGGGTGKCTEECLFSADRECDDGGPGSSTDLCLPGTDCRDCGAR
jgi:hypothetical protein